MVHHKRNQSHVQYQIHRNARKLNESALVVAAAVTTDFEMVEVEKKKHFQTYESSKHSIDKF